VPYGEVVAIVATDRLRARCLPARISRAHNYSAFSLFAVL